MNYFRSLSTRPPSETGSPFAAYFTRVKWFVRITGWPSRK